MKPKLRPTETNHPGVGGGYCISKLPLTVALLLLMSACSHHSGSSSAASPASPSSGLLDQLNALQKSGSLPTLDISASVAGPDANQNGVRDDIDAFIAARPDSAGQKAALSQYAKALQTTLLIDTTQPSADSAAAVEIGRSIACIWSAYDPATAYQMTKDLQKYTVNTLPRIKAYDRFNFSMSGSVLTAPTGVVCG
jgi:hypothetical protein